MRSIKLLIWPLIPLFALFFLGCPHAFDAQDEMVVDLTILEESGVSELAKHHHISMLRITAFDRAFNLLWVARELIPVPHSTDSHQTTVLRM